MRLHFLGASRQVTGSRYLLEAAGLRIMIDCGMFQERSFLHRNWEMPLVEPEAVDVLLLTHAHLDHCGLVPRLVAGGFDRRIVTTEPSVDLARLMMIDSAGIQEEDAAYKRKRHRRENRKGPHPVEPLYTVNDAERAIRLLQGVEFGEPFVLGEGVSVTFHEAGHILGAAILELNVDEAGTTRTLVFSGDLGQWSRPLVHDPTLLDAADFVVMESTYGDRSHREEAAIADQLAEVINETVERGGNVVIPTFALERAQELVYYLGRLVRERRIPRLRAFLDSPMAVDVTEIFRRNRRYLDDEAQDLFARGHAPLRWSGLKMVRDVEDSKAINEAPSPCIIMSTSGMCTAGRIKHHLRRNIERSDSTILFVGYQAQGTLGRLIRDRKERVRIHGRQYDVRARIAEVHGFSAHGDREDLLRWLGSFGGPSGGPRQVFLTHGEARAAEALAVRIRDDLGLEVSVPEYQSVVELGRKG